MRWYDKRYHSLNYELRSIFGQKVIKLSLDGGFTCPNRDGTIGNKGCIFCNESGSGEFTASRKLTIRNQIRDQKEFLSSKWRTGKYIAYFQNFTSTYDSVDVLKRKYMEALNCEGIVGLAIATRPDCLSENILNLLSEINERTYLWIELGLQTIHEKTARLIRRGYDLDCFKNAVNNLHKRNIRGVVHLIFGLPNETKKQILDTVKYISHIDLYGVKIHSLYILYGTDLYQYYLKNNFNILEKDEYISLVTDAIELLPPSIVIHRLTGDGPRDDLYKPRWGLDKLSVLTSIDKELKVRNSYQGYKYNR